MWKKVFWFLNKMADGPGTWSKRNRRLFVLTLPLSLPLYALLIAVMLLVAFLAMIVIWPIMMIHDMWTKD